MLSNLVAALSAGATTALLVCLPIVGIALGAVVAFFVIKSVTEKRIGNSKKEAERILEEARQEAKGMRKEALLEAKEEQLRLRNEFEKESKQRRAEIQKTENRLNQKEDSLDKKELILDNKIEAMDRAKQDIEKKKQELDVRENELEQQRANIVLEIQKVAGITREDAKQILINEMTDEAKLEAAGMVKEIEAKAK